MGSLPAGFVTAKAIYETGAHSKPTGTCTLISPTTLGQAVARRAAVVFTSNNGDSVSGSAYSAYAASATSISFTYPVSDQRVQPASSACYVGSMPDADKSVLGCIAGSSDATSTAGFLPIMTLAGVSSSLVSPVPSWPSLFAPQAIRWWSSSSNVCAHYEERCCRGATTRWYSWWDGFDYLLVDGYASSDRTVIVTEAGSNYVPGWWTGSQV